MRCIVDAMSKSATRFRELVVQRVLDGPGRASAGARRAAFDNRGVAAPARALIDKVARHAWNITDADVATTKAAGVSEDEIEDALNVAFAFNVITRLADTFRFEVGPRAAFDAGADRLLSHGYK